MLTRFSVSGVRNFCDRVTLDLSDVRDYAFSTECIKDGVINNALILGRNSSGKTNLGMALLDVQDNFRVRDDFSFAQMDDPLYMNADTDEPVAMFSYCFNIEGNEIEYSYSRDSDRRVVNERLVVEDDLVFERDSPDSSVRVGDLSRIGANGLNMQFSDETVSVLAYVTNFMAPNSKSLAVALRDEISSMRMRSSGSSSGLNRLSRRTALNRLIKRNEVERLESFLKRFGIKDQLEVRVEPDGSKAIYTVRKSRPIPFATACSSGTLTLVDVFTTFEFGNAPSLVYLDEFDAYCHYEVAEELLRYFSEKRDCQTICATHNTSLTKNNSTRPDCVFQITEEHGIRSLANSTSRELRRGNNIEKLYRAGEFD